MHPRGHPVGNDEVVRGIAPERNDPGGLAELDHSLAVDAGVL